MSNTFHEYALEQLGRVVPITSRNISAALASILPTSSSR